MRPLWKTKVVIWTEYDPDHLGLEQLAREANSGDAICSLQISFPVESPEDEPDWEEVNHFFEHEERDEE